MKIFKLYILMFIFERSNNGFDYTIKRRLLFFWFCQLPMSDLRLQELHGPSRCLSLFISWMVETVRLTYFRQSIVM